MKSRFAMPGKIQLNLMGIAALTLFAVTPPALASNTWYVDGVNGNDSNDCKSPQAACKTIGHAISLASSGDSIMVAAATYVENLTIGFNLKILARNATKTIIDGGATNTVIIVNSGQVTLSRLTIQNGVAMAGGGIRNNGTLTVNNSTIIQNHAKAGFGGGLGGGIYNTGTLTLNSSTLSRNSTPHYGGGIYNARELTISGSTISGNDANAGYNTGITAAGGGIYNAGTLTLNNSTLSGNYAISAGDVNCTGTYGGGIDSQFRTLINNSTLSGNYATSSCSFSRGGGIYGSVTLQNTLVTNSTTGGNCSGTMTSNGYNLSSDGSCNFNGTGDLNNIDPLLGQLGNYGGPTQTIPLLPGSPAIDSGNPSGCTDGQGHLLKTDQRSKPRPDKEDSGGCDIGAYESQKD